MKLFSIFTLFVTQFFTYAFARFIIWLFAVQSAPKRTFIYASSFILSNGLILATVGLHFNKIIHLPSLPRWTAAWMVLLLFTFFTSLIVLFLEHLSRLLFKHPQKYQRAIRIFAPFILLSFFATALYNAYTPVIRHAKIHINKPLSQPVRVGMASDLHLGVLVGARQLDKIAQIMQNEKVDIILLPGDIMDDDTQAYDAENMKPHLEKLRAPLGVFATLGNHDLFGHQNEIAQAIQSAGITLLHDNAVKIRDFWVVGRPDNLDRQRLDTAQLLRQTNPKEAIFLLDHRPDNVTEHSQLPIDVQVSGHVHNGQIFPANFIVRQLNRIAYGYGMINHKHFFVSSGFGFWGVPLRLGSQSEVWVIDITGESPK